MQTLTQRIQEKLAAQPLVIIGLDGQGAAGKSTLARYLQSNFEGAQIVEMDDFYKPWAERKEERSPVAQDLDLDHLENDLLRPLLLGQSIDIVLYDWDLDRMAKQQKVSAKGLVILEGVYSTMQRLVPYLDLKIWIEAPYDLRLRRGLERDGVHAQSLWEDIWMPQEDYYIEKENPASRADFIFTANDLKGAL